MTQKYKYVILRNIHNMDKFFTTNSDNPTLCNGEVMYAVIGYGNTIAECQIKLYGKSYTTSKD